ncbi:MAG: DUF4258 domain-containing protein [Gemmatimonadota bacterium]|nr:DUF4258 domain-containing protein [Gemmatimonadota bacterium]
MDIRNIIRSVEIRNYRITHHAMEEAANDRLNLEEIFHALNNGEIIEYYLDDRPYPSCLIYGRNVDGEPIHSVWAYNENNQMATLITVYRPNPARWIGWRDRRNL